MKRSPTPAGLPCSRDELHAFRGALIVGFRISLEGKMAVSIGMDAQGARDAMMTISHECWFLKRADDVDTRPPLAGFRRSSASDFRPPHQRDASARRSTAAADRLAGVAFRLRRRWMPRAQGLSNAARPGGRLPGSSVVMPRRAIERQQ